MVNALSFNNLLLLQDYTQTILSAWLLVDILPTSPIAPIYPYFIAY